MRLRRKFIKMSHLLKKYRGRVNLIYIDPPFDSKADYKKRITLRGKPVLGDRMGFEEKQYTDIWTNDERRGGYIFRMKISRFSKRNLIRISV